MKLTKTKYIFLNLLLLAIFILVLFISLAGIDAIFGLETLLGFGFFASCTFLITFSSCIIACVLKKKEKGQ
jgi:hypothetical protein